MKKSTIKLLLLVSLLSSVALADGDLGNGTKLCGDLGNGTCRTYNTDEKDPIDIKDESNESSKNTIIEWISDFLVENFS